MSGNKPDSHMYEEVTFRRLGGTSVCLKIMWDDDNICMELVFTRGFSLSQQKKVKEFWKFLDAANNLHPYTPESGIGVIHIFLTLNDTIENTYPNMIIPIDSKLSKEIVPCEPTSCSQKSTPSKRIWQDELKVFQQLGLDKIALAADETCKFCYAESKNRCTDYADTVKEPYEELNEEMRAFEERLENRTKLVTDLTQT